MVRVGCIALAGLFILGCNSSKPAGTSDGQSAASASPDDRAAGTHERVESLIANLADNSEHPGGGLTAWTRLRELGVDAFPEIVEHLEDDGFAFAPTAARPTTIGPSAGLAATCCGAISSHTTRRYL